MKEISSLKNSLIKQASSLDKKVNRDETGLFLIEGEKGVFEAVKDGLDIENIFIDRDRADLLKELSFDNAFKAPSEVLGKISTTKSPPPVIATVKTFKHSLEELINQSNSLIILLENIKDAGNLGTIIRTAVASGASGIVITGNSVDMFNPKVVRSAVANLWKIPIIYEANQEQLKEKLIKTKPFQFLATKVDNKNKNIIYYDIDYNKPTVLMFGSEAEGLSEELCQIADNFIHIPMKENIESLNLSISVGVILYEAVRQRS